MPSKNKFEIHNDQIDISHDKWEKLAFTTYREDYFEEISNLTWTKTGEYLQSKKLGKYLHRYIMEKWYGPEMLKVMTENGFVVDHLNNDGFDCRIQNLEFLQDAENKAKGLTIDQQINDIREKIAISMFKDFSTGLYQLTLGFNQEVGEYKDGYIYPVTAVKFLYKGDYIEVINDVRKIILDYSLYKRIDTPKLNYIDKEVIYTVFLNIKKHEKGSPIITRNNQSYIILNDSTKIYSLTFKKGWGMK